MSHECACSTCHRPILRAHCLWCSYVLSIRDLRSQEERHLVAEHIIICHGILGRQYLPQASSHTC